MHRSSRYILRVKKSENKYMGHRPAVMLLPAVALFIMATGYTAPAREDSSPIPPDSVKNLYEGKKLVQYYFTEGIKAYKIDKDTEGAVNFFDMAIGLDPDHSPSYFEAANALSTTDPFRALGYSRNAVSLDTANVWYASQLGRLYIVTGDYNKARRNYEKLIVMAPKNPENYGMLSLLYQQTGQPYAAIAVLERAENVLGKIEQLAQYKTELLIELGLFDQAIEEAKSTVAAYPYNYESYLALAQLYAEGKKDSLAMENYNMAIALNPDGLDVLSSLSEYYRIKGDMENYIATGRKLLLRPELNVETKVQMVRELMANRKQYRDHYFSVRDLASTLYVHFPEDYGVVTLYADNIRYWGDFDEATEVHKNYISIPRDEMQPYMDVISMEAYKQNHDSVKKYTELALERFPTNPELYVRLGGTQSWLGDSKQALKSYEKALKYSEGDSVKSVILGVIGDEYHKIGDKKNCYKFYERALALWDENIVVLNNYAYYLSEEEKELDKALTMAEKAIAREPDNGTYIDTYGWVLFKMGRLEEAKTAIRQAIALDSRGSSELLLHYGDILWELGDSYMATVYWKRALDAGHDEGEIERRLKLTAE